MGFISLQVVEEFASEVPLRSQRSLLPTDNEYGSGRCQALTFIEL